MKVQALRLFGSHARGDNDEISDKDILLVVPSKHDVRKVRSGDHRPPSADPGVDLSVYSEARMRELYHEGSLFAWHLHLESRKLDTNLAHHVPDLLDVLGEPSPYRDWRADVEVLGASFFQLQQFLAQTPRNAVFEAGNAYVSARNIGISLSWHLESGPVFGRKAPFSVAEVVEVDFPLSDAEYEVLARARRAGHHGADLNLAPQTVSEILDNLTPWVEACLAKARELQA